MKKWPRRLRVAMWVCLALVGAVAEQIIRQPLQGIAMAAHKPMTGLEHRQRPPEGRRRNVTRRDIGH